MSTPSGPVAYAIISLNIYGDEARASLAAYGCIIDPDGTLQIQGGSYPFSVEVPLNYGTTADDVKTAIGQAIATGYGGSAPDVVLIPSF